MADLDNLNVPELPTSSMDTAVVTVIGRESNNGAWDGTLTEYPEIWNNSRIRFTLSGLAGGGSCTVEFPRPPAWDQAVQFDLMNASAGDCDTTLSKTSQLIGSTLTTSVYLQRDDKLLWDNYGVLIDYIGLSTTAGPYTAPLSSNVVTSDATTSGGGSSFNVYGPVSTPRNNWDVHWNGPATNDPLVAGSMVVNSLGSDMAPTADAGAVCCTVGKPSERRVLLSAFINGRLRASSIVRISDQSGGAFNPGQAAVIEEWRLCKRPSTDSRCPDL